MKDPLYPERNSGIAPAPVLAPETGIHPSNLKHLDPSSGANSGPSGQATSFSNLILDDIPSIPGYRIIREIARGGMGRVLAAIDLVLDREIALKILLPGARFDRFVRESKITARLPHPGIPPVHTLGTLADGSHFLAMKLIDGRTLAEEMKTADPLRLLPAFTQVCQAVGFAHSRGVIHRDLKPANIMLGSFGEVQVMDWGLAKDLTCKDPEGESLVSAEVGDGPTTTVVLLERGVDAEGGTTAHWYPGQTTDEKTQAGQVMGTPAYMAPEQARGEPTDTRADVFALGGILCAILTGEGPFSGKSSMEVIRRAASADLTQALARLDGCGADGELVALCRRCLNPNPLNRPADGRDVAVGIQAYLAGVQERLQAAEREQAVTVARAEEEIKRRQVEEEKNSEERKRRKVQQLLAVSMIGLVTAGVVGVALLSLWQSADIARWAAEEAQKDVKREQEKLAVFEYGRTIQVARNGLNENDIPTTIALLDETKEDFRGWEWDYLQRLCHSELLSLKGHTGWVFSVSFSRDGSRVLTSGLDRTAKVWDGKTGVELLTLRGHTGHVHSAAFSWDGLRIVTGGKDNTAKVWDAKTGAELFTLTGHSENVSSVSFNSDGSRILTGSWDKTAKVWDARAWFKTGPIGNLFSQMNSRGNSEIITLRGHNERVNSASFSQDGLRVVTGSDDKTAKVWDAKTGVELRALKGHTDLVNSVKFSEDGVRIVTGSWDKTAKVWDARTGIELLTLKGHNGQIYSASFSFDGSKIVTGSWDKTVRIWDATTGAEILNLKGHTDHVTSVSFNGDGSRVVTGSRDRMVKVWDTIEGPEQTTLRGHRGPVSSASFSADGNWIITGSFDGSAKVWDAGKGCEIQNLQGHRGMVFCASFSPDGMRVVTGGEDKTARIWDRHTGAEILTLNGHADGVHSASFTMDGKRVVTGSSDKTAKLWNAMTGELIFTLEGHSAKLCSAAFRGDGYRILTSGFDNSARVWKVGENENEMPEMQILRGHTGCVSSASFRADGELIVTSSFDKTGRVWNARNGTELFTLRGHMDRVNSAFFSPNGFRIVTASVDKTAKVWDAKTGADLLTLKGHEGEVNSASFSWDGSRIVTASHDNTAKIWDSRPYWKTRFSKE